MVHVVDFGEICLLSNPPPPTRGVEGWHRNRQPVIIFTSINKAPLIKSTEETVFSIPYKWGGTKKINSVRYFLLSDDFRNG